MSSNYNSNDPKLDVKDDEKHLLLDHSYDGIQELNHPLPSWWNVIFYTSCAFAAGYFVYYQLLGGASLRQEFTVSYGKILEAQAEFKKANSRFNFKHYNAIVADDGVKKGAAVFETNCLACHAEGGKGDIGPNLTDDHWVVAKGTPETVYNVVFNGSEENGMPAWAELLPKDEVYQAVAYVASLKNTFVKGGKEPQGEKIDETAETVVEK
jgi:cytochrome c oxidase cbb3-type subunit 3